VEKTNNKSVGQLVTIGITEYKRIFDYCLASATIAHEILQNVELIMKLGQEATEDEADHILALATKLNSTSLELLDFVSFVVSMRRKA